MPGHFQRNCPVKKYMTQQGYLTNSNQTQQTGGPQGFSNQAGFQGVPSQSGFPNMTGFSPHMMSMWSHTASPAANPFPWAAFWQIQVPQTTSTQTPNPHLKALN